MDGPSGSKPDMTLDDEVLTIVSGISFADPLLDHNLPPLWIPISQPPTRPILQRHQQHPYLTYMYEERAVSYIQTG